MRCASGRFWLAVTTFGGITLMGGCTQFYNGAVGLSTGDRQAAERYQAYRQDREDRLQQARGEQKRSGRSIGAGPQTGIQAGPHAGAFNASRSVPSSGGRSVASAVSPAEGGRGAGSYDPMAVPDGVERSVPTSRSQGRTGLGVYGQRGLSESQAGTSPLDGPGNLRRMTFTAEGADFDVTLDPAGRTMVYASTRHRETADLYAQRIDGTAVEQLTDDPGNDVMPAVSPDGQHIAFASDRGGSWDLYVMSIHGGPAVQLTQDRSQNIHPTWSPDGRQIAYCAYGSATGQWEIVLIDVAHPAVKRYLTQGLFPTWHPTEDRLLFQRARQRGTRWFSLWTVELVAGEATRPTEIIASSNAAVITPAWSRDGQHIAFCTVADPEAEEDRPTVSDLWLMRADGTGRTRLTSGPFAHLQPTWSPDGLLYFVSDRAHNGVENVWMLDPGRALAAVQGAVDREDRLGRSGSAPSVSAATLPLGTAPTREAAAPQIPAQATGRSPVPAPRAAVTPEVAPAPATVSLPRLEADPFLPDAVQQAAAAVERP